MRSLALVALLVLAVGAGCASKRIVPTYETRAPSYAPRTTYSSTACAPSYTSRNVYRTPSRPAAPVYGTSYGRRVTYASAVPPPPPPPPLYRPRASAPARTVVYSARTSAPRSVVTPARRPAPRRAAPVAPVRKPSRSSGHKHGVSFVGGFAGVIPPSSCST